MTRNIERNGKGKSILALVSISLAAGGAFAADQERPVRAGEPSASDRYPASTNQALTAESFVKTAAWSGHKEIRLGKIALQKAQRSDVKEFAGEIVRDHSKANQRLMQIAKEKGIELPSMDELVEAGVYSSGVIRDSDKDLEATQGAGAKKLVELTERSTPAIQLEGKRDSAQTGRDDQDVAGRQLVRDMDDPAKMKQHDLHAIQQLEQKSGAEFDRAFIQHMVQDHSKAVRKFELASTTLPDQELKRFASETLPTLRQHHQKAVRLAAQTGGAIDEDRKKDQPDRNQPDRQ